MFGCLTVDIIGWVLLIANQTTAQSLVGCFCISLGAFPGIILLQAWVNANTIGFTRRYFNAPSITPHLWVGLFANDYL